MLNLGIITPSSSSWSSPLHLVPKKSGDWRPSGDYRSLNTKTVPDRYPLPNIQDFPSALQGTTIFTKTYLVRAYPRNPVADSSTRKRADSDNKPSNSLVITWTPTASARFLTKCKASSSFQNHCQPQNSTSFLGSYTFTTALSETAPHYWNP